MLVTSVSFGVSCVFIIRFVFRRVSFPLPYATRVLGWYREAKQQGTFKETTEEKQSKPEVLTKETLRDWELYKLSPHYDPVWCNTQQMVIQKDLAVFGEPYDPDKHGKGK